MDADGDVEMATAQPVFEVIAAPKLVSWNQSTLVAWGRERIQYENKIQQRCGVTGEGYQNVAATGKDSILPGVLDNLCRYVLQRDVSDVTDEEIASAITERCRTLKNQYVPGLKALFARELRMDMSLDDIDARIFKYFQDFNRLVQDNGLHSMVGDAPHDPNFRSRMKTRASLIIDNLQPPLLKTRIARLAESARRDCRENDVALYGLILEHSRVQHQMYMLQQEERDKRERQGITARPRSDTKRPSAEVDRKPAGRSGGTASSGGGNVGNGGRGRSSEFAGKKAESRRAPPRDGCLVCSGSHWVCDCPTATQAQKDGALARMRAQKDTKNHRALRSGVADTEQLVGSVQINGVHEVQYVVDSGADRTIIPSAVVASLLSLNPQVMLTQLSPPVAVKVADGRHLRRDQEVKVELKLMTAAGPVRVGSVRCLVIPSDGAELLIGDDLMRSLGIDVTHMLEQLVQAPIVEERDPFPFVEGAATASSDLDAVLESKVKEALSEFRDVWRTELDPDPLARLEPLKMELKPGATPVRCKPRRYAPLQSQSLRSYTRQLESFGLLRRNNLSRWASAAYPIHKPGSAEGFRMTIDYRAVNRLAVPIAGTMPNLNVVTSRVEGSRALGNFDLMKGFWQLPLHEESQ